MPNGLRMVETLLLREYSERDVVVCYVDQLERFVGPETKVLAIHAHNLLGISYATDVYSKLAGENLMPVNAHEFIRIVTHPIIQKFKPKIVVGGPGAWQLEKANRLDEFKIDYLIDGEIERVFSDLFRRILAGDPTVERIVKIPKEIQPPVEEIPVVRHRSTFGVCEVVPYSHVRHKDSTDPHHKIADPIIGLETGSPRLFNTYMKGKAYPYKAHQWRDVILRGMEILNRHNWFPFCTFIIGLPGETNEDTRQSLDLLYDLRHAKGTFVPTFFVPLENTRMQRTNGAKLIEMTDLQWEFFFTCWKYNLAFWRGGSRSSLKFSAGVPIYYSLLGKKLFGQGIKYPLLRFAGVPDRLMRKRLYLDFTGHKRNPNGVDHFAEEIVPAFQSVREKGLNMVDAS